MTLKGESKLARLQIGFEGFYEGRGFFRRIFGSGPLRITPLDVAVAEKDVEKVDGAVQIITLFIVGVAPSKHRLGSLFNIIIKPFVKLRII